MNRTDSDPLTRSNRGAMPLGVIVVVLGLMAVVGGCTALLVAGGDGQPQLADASTYRLTDFTCVAERDGSSGERYPVAAGTLLNATDEATTFTVRIEAVDRDRPSQPAVRSVSLQLEPGESEDFDVALGWPRTDPTPDFDPLRCTIGVWSG